MNFIDNSRKLRGFEKNIKVEKISRRSILKGLGIAGGFVLAAPVMSRQAFAYETGAGKMPHGVVVDPRVFVAVGPDGTVTIVAHRAEIGISTNHSSWGIDLEVPPFSARKPGGAKTCDARPRSSRRFL